MSQSALFEWRHRIPSERELQDKELTDVIVDLFGAHRSQHGAVFMVQALRKKGLRVGVHRVRRLMTDAGLVRKTPKRTATTTKVCASSSASPNLVQRDFTAEKPGALWLSNITYIPTYEGFLFLCIILDMATRKVVGWSMKDTLHHSLATDALAMACAHHEVPDGAVFHSDRGVQYSCHAFREALQRYGLTQSMSRKGNCWDNAPAESFFATLKREGTVCRTYRSRAEARSFVFDYIEGYYNSRRFHSSLNYQTPNEMMAAFEKDLAA